MTTDIHTGPLPQAAPTDEHHPGPLPAAQRVRKSGQEKRWERRRRRLVVEEVMGWVLVPVMLLAVFWATKAGLSALGTTPTALIQGLKTAISASGRL